MMLTSSLVAQDKPTVLTLEVAPDPRGAIGSQQEWIKVLQQVGADRVVSNGRGAKAAIEEKETEANITIYVNGFIERDKLVLPGGKFTSKDVAGIRQLLQKFRDDGGEITLSEKKAFGLTAKQLVYVHAKLAVPIEFKTKGQPLKAVVKQLKQQADLTFVETEQARRVLAGDTPVMDELEGLSTGTGLAAIVRPFGLVLEPNYKQGDGLRIELKASTESQEHWPIGWPSKVVPVKTEPKMFEKMPIQIKNFPLDKVLDAVQKKCGVPFLVDHNSLARAGIEMSETKVTVVESDISITRLLSSLLRQSRPRMSQDLRVDEQGKAFVWLYTTR